MTDTEIEIAEAYREDTYGRYYHVPIVTKKGSARKKMPKEIELGSVNLREPITKDKFAKLSDSLKVMYIKNLHEEYGATGQQISAMLGYNNRYFNTILHALGINHIFPKGLRGSKEEREEQKRRWDLFVNKNEKTDEPSVKPEPVVTRGNAVTYELVDDIDLSGLKKAPIEIFTASKPEVKYEPSCDVKYVTLNFSGEFCGDSVAERLRGLFPTGTPVNIYVEVSVIDKELE